jgi:hypothetical protein
MTPAEIAVASGSGPHDEAYFAGLEAAHWPPNDGTPWVQEEDGGWIIDEARDPALVHPKPVEYERWTEDEPEPGEDLSHGPFVPLSAIDATAPPPLILDRIDPEGHTILFGTGDVGKGSLATSWVARLVDEGFHKPWHGGQPQPIGQVLILDYENHPREWARRFLSLSKTTNRDMRVFWAGPLRPDFPKRGAIWNHAETVRKIVTNYGIELVVVDSIVPACGGADVMEPGAPARYAGAIQAFGAPVLSIGHVTKADDARYPFGSIFWHNLARVSWSLTRAAGGRLELVNRKSNNYAKQGRFEVVITWHEDELREVWERPYSAALGERIDDVLADGPLTATEITDRLNEECDVGEEPVKLDSVGRTLRRGLTGIAPRYEIAGTGKTARWARR